MSPAMPPCVVCKLPREMHDVNGVPLINGSMCTGYDDGSPTIEERILAASKGKTRRVSVDVPDGYALKIELVPLEALEVSGG